MTSAEDQASCHSEIAVMCYTNGWTNVIAVDSNNDKEGNTEKSDVGRRKHCALAVVMPSQKISPRRRPPSRVAGRPKFNQLEMVTTFIYKPGLVGIDARNFELS